METYERSSCVHGYHVYQRVWSAAVSELLSCQREPANSQDRYAVAVKKNGTIIGRLPRRNSKVCLLFLMRGSTISRPSVCSITHYVPLCSSTIDFSRLVDREGTPVIYHREGSRFHLILCFLRNAWRSSNSKKKH